MSNALSGPLLITVNEFGFNRAQQIVNVNVAATDMNHLFYGNNMYDNVATDIGALVLGGKWQKCISKNTCNCRRCNYSACTRIQSCCE
jgi:hypothetical protein